VRRQLVRLLNRLLTPLGLQLERKKTEILESAAVMTPVLWTPLEAALHGLLGAKGSLSVLHIGANDGKWNDPIHAFMMGESAWTRILLVEPQPEIAAFLAQTYRDHPATEIFEGVVLPTPGEVLLHRVRPSLWDLTEMPYLKDAPSYRAPSGFASTDRAHVERHVASLRWRHDGLSVPTDEAIEELRVPTLTFPELRSAFPDFFPLDVLQVDVEGIDDRLILAALSAGIVPLIMNLEVAHLSPERHAVLQSELERFGYRSVRTGADLLAVRAPAGTS
jgi:hypothetical protein